MEPVWHCPFDGANQHRHLAAVNFCEQSCGSGAINIETIKIFIIIFIFVFISSSSKNNSNNVIAVVVIMNSYYASQMASSRDDPCHGAAKQFGSGVGLGAFLLRVERTALPLLRNFRLFCEASRADFFGSSFARLCKFNWGEKVRTVKRPSDQRQREKILAEVVETSAASGRRRVATALRWAGGQLASMTGGQAGKGKQRLLLNHCPLQSLKTKSAKRSRVDVLANVKFNNIFSVWQNEL